MNDGGKLYTVLEQIFTDDDFCISEKYCESRLKKYVKNLK